MVSSRLRLSLLAILALVLLVFPRERLAEAETVVPDGIEQLQYSFAPLVKRVSPAVVNVYVTHRVKEFVSPFDESYLREFFGDDYAGPRERLQNSLGSGVIVSADGLVVTNNHVVAGRGEAEIRIALADKREFDAKLIKTDKKADLAVLRIEAPDVTFPFLELEDSDGLEVGDLVLAIGNPFGVGQTVTSGIVSALARTSVMKSDAQYFIQTDAAINPGNSGGALIDMRGKLVGINTAIFSRSGGSHGIGFAIPSNLVRPTLESAITGVEVKKPWFGARLEPVTSDIAQALGLERVEGAFVTRVYDSGPASNAGIKPKDVVIALDGHEIADPSALTYRLTTKGIGGTTMLKVIRDGETLDVAIELAAAPGLDAGSQVELSGPNPFDGARVAQITPALAEEMEIDEVSEGVVIVDVQAGSIAQGLGFRRGDVLLRVARARIRELDDLERATRKPQRVWRIDVRRGTRVYQMAVPG